MIIIISYYYYILLCLPGKLLFIHLLVYTSNIAIVCHCGTYYNHYYYASAVTGTLELYRGHGQIYLFFIFIICIILLLLFHVLCQTGWLVIWKLYHIDYHTTIAYHLFSYKNQLPFFTYIFANADQAHSAAPTRTLNIPLDSIAWNLNKASVNVFGLKKNCYWLLKYTRICSMDLCFFCYAKSAEISFSKNCRFEIKNNNTTPSCDVPNHMTWRSRDHHKSRRQACGGFQTE